MSTSIQLSGRACCIQKAAVAGAWMSETQLRPRNGPGCKRTERSSLPCATKARPLPYDKRFGLIRMMHVRQCTQG
jgi:hypothetical protein